MKKRKYLYSSLATMLALGVVAYRQNHKLDIQMLSYHNKKLPSVFEGFRILHVSDFHDVQFGQQQNKILKQIQIIQPDIIVLSGDMIDQRKTTKENIHRNFTFIEGIVKIAPVYYVPGNHEATSSIYPYLKSFLINFGVHVLEDAKVELSREQEKISLLGLKDPKFYYHECCFEKQLATISKTITTSFRILISHRHEKLKLYEKYGVDLAFCGHAHGGQIRIPKIGGLYAPGQGIFPAYTDGFYKLHACTMVVSRGLGNSRAPLRVNNHPQLVVVRLHKM